MTRARPTPLAVLLMLFLAAAAMVVPRPEPAVAAPPQARADEAVLTADTGKRQVHQLVRAGVNHEAAKALGYEIRLDAAGMEYPVPAGSPAGAGLGPDNTVPGPCGQSWLYWREVDQSRHRGSIYSGFDIRVDWPPAVNVEWDLYVADQYGVSEHRWGPYPIWPAHSWFRRLVFTASGPTGAYAQVQAGIVMLADTTICIDLDPWDYTYL